MNFKFEYQLQVCVLAALASGLQTVVLLAPLAIVVSNSHLKLMVYIFFVTLIRTTGTQSGRCKINHQKASPGLTRTNLGSCGPTEGPKVIQAM
jgi:hypothetical protein